MIISASTIRALILDALDQEYGEESEIKEQGKRIVVSPRDSDEKFVILVSPGRESAS